MQDETIPKDKQFTAVELALLFFTLIVLVVVAIDTLYPLPAEADRVVHWLDNIACAIFFANTQMRKEVEAHDIAAKLDAIQAELRDLRKEVGSGRSQVPDPATGVRNL